MTNLLYQTDSYLREFTAMVSGHVPEQNGVLLDQTAFYPGGGGQPNDIGVLESANETYTVASVGRGNVHVLVGELPAIGTPVKGVLDWERRYKLMRTHTAMHILCGVVWRDYSASVTGGNMEPLSGRMDFEFERLQKELVSEIEERINAEVAAKRDIRVKILPHAEAFEIPDLIRTKINLLP